MENHPEKFSTGHTQAVAFAGVSGAIGDPGRSATFGLKPLKSFNRFGKPMAETAPCESMGYGKEWQTMEAP